MIEPEPLCGVAPKLPFQRQRTDASPAPARFPCSDRTPPPSPLAPQVEDPRDQWSNLRMLGIGGFIGKRRRQLLNIPVHALIGCGAVGCLLLVFDHGATARLKKRFVT